MKKINLNILIFIVLFHIILSQDCENFNSTEDECQNATTKGKYPTFCCYYKAIYPIKDPSLNKCKAVPYSSYYSDYNKEYLDGILYNVTCNKTLGPTTYILEQCGNTQGNVDSLKDCKKYSTFVDSCCYYSGPNKNEIKKGCYWLGSKYEGKINWAGVQLECYQKYLNYSLISIFYLIILIFVIF